MYVCICNALTDTQVTRAIENGCRATQRRVQSLWHATPMRALHGNHVKYAGQGNGRSCPQPRRVNSALTLGFANLFLQIILQAGFFNQTLLSLQPVNMLFRIVQYFHENIAGHKIRFGFAKRNSFFQT